MNVRIEKAGPTKVAARQLEHGSYFLRHDGTVWMIFMDFRANSYAVSQDGYLSSAMRDSLVIPCTADGKPLEPEVERCCIGDILPGGLALVDQEIYVCATTDGRFARTTDLQDGRTRLMNKEQQATPLDPVRVEGGTLVVRPRTKGKGW